MSLSRSLTNRVLIAVSATSALVTAGLWLALSNDIGDVFFAPTVVQDAPPVSIETLETDFSITPVGPTASALQSPPSGFLDGLQVNPFLLGVVGKENQDVETIAENPVFDRDLVLNMPRTGSINSSLFLRRCETAWVFGSTFTLSTIRTAVSFIINVSLGSFIKWSMLPTLATRRCHVYVG